MKEEHKIKNENTHTQQNKKKKNKSEKFLLLQTCFIWHLNDKNRHKDLISLPKRVLKWHLMRD